MNFLDIGADEALDIVQSVIGNERLYALLSHLVVVLTLVPCSRTWSLLSHLVRDNLGLTELSSGSEQL